MNRNLKLRRCRVAAAALAIFLPSCDASESEAEATERVVSATPVRVEPIRIVELDEVVEVSASLEPVMRARLTPEVGGVVTTITKDLGDTVDKDELLVRISASDYSLALDQARSGAAGAQAGLRQAEASFNNAKQQYDRYKDLRQKNAVTQAEFEQVETAFLAAEAAVEAARSQTKTAKTGIRSAKRRVADTVLRAPFAGFVVARHVDPGEVVRPMGSAVLELVNIDEVFAEGALSELESPRVKVGMTASVFIDALGSEPMKGEVVMVGHEVDSRTRTVAIRVRLDNGAGRLKAGMSGRISVAVGQRKGPVIPRVALASREGRDAHVFVVVDGKVQDREVVVDPRFDDLIPVLDGLAVGETVVTWGHARLSDGAEVSILGAEEGAPPTEADSNPVQTPTVVGAAP